MNHYFNNHTKQDRRWLPEPTEIWWEHMGGDDHEISEEATQRLDDIIFEISLSLDITEQEAQEILTYEIIQKNKKRNQK